MIVTADLLVYAEGDQLFEEGYRKIATGNVYNDIKKRFPDGMFIRTSPIVREEGDLIITENSVYRRITENPKQD